MKSYVILISGRGSNMCALLDANLPGRCAAVISNRPEAAGLDFARSRDIATEVVDHRAGGGRVAFDAALAAAIDRHRPDLVLLAGFMRILGDDLVVRYANRMLNIHPSLLPAFPGIDTHARALAAGARIHGCSVHFVIPSLDAGPIVAQAAVPVWPTDNAATLAARVLEQEHRLYPRAARWFLEGLLSMADDGRVRLAGERPVSGVLDVPGS